MKSEVFAQILTVILYKNVYSSLKVLKHLCCSMREVRLFQFYWPTNIISQIHGYKFKVLIEICFIRHTPPFLHFIHSASVDLHKMMVSPYCWRQRLQKSLTVEKSSWCIPRAFTLLTCGHVTGGYSALYRRRKVHDPSYQPFGVQWWPPRHTSSIVVKNLWE